jgi:hypothetical protein
MQPNKNVKDRNSIESVLIADCGSNTTRVVLVEVVDNAYRFVARGVAPSTIEDPYYNVTVGVLNAISAIQASTGRRLLSGNQLIVPQTEDGNGVDAFIASSSAAEAMRIVAAGLIKAISTQILAQASHSTYTQILDTISLDDFGDTSYNFSSLDVSDSETEFSPFLNGLARPSIFELGAETLNRPAQNKKKPGMSLFGDRSKHAWRDRQVAKLRRLNPNVVILSGGVEGAPIEPILELVSVIITANQQEAVLAEATGEARRPLTMIFAGNQQAQDAIISKLGGRIEFFLTDNICPAVGKEQLAPLQQQLSDLYQERVLPTLPGYDRLAQMSHAPINTTCHAVGLMSRFLAKAIENNRVLTADLGGGSASLFYASQTAYTEMVMGNFGMSFGISNVMAETSVDNIKRYLPFASSDDEIVHYALNKALRPQLLPANERELQIEAAFGRVILRHLYKAMLEENPHAHDYNRLIGVGGALVSVHPWQATLILLDSFEPLAASGTGLLDLEIDSTMLMAASGALAAYNPNAAAYVFQYDCLHRLGSVIVPVGNGTLGSPAVTVKMITKRGRTKEVNVPFGEMSLIPLRSDEMASLEIIPHKGFRIGSARAGEPVKTQAGAELRGGSVGIIIDARGRPVRYAVDPAARQEQMLRWYNTYRDVLLKAESEGVISSADVPPMSVMPAPPPPKPVATPPTTQRPLGTGRLEIPPPPLSVNIADVHAATPPPMPTATPSPPAPIEPQVVRIPPPVGDPTTAPYVSKLAQLREEDAKTAKIGQEPSTGGALSKRTKGRTSTTTDDSSLANLRDAGDDKKKKKK